MKANDANTLAASVGCPVGANGVEWLVAEVKRLREQVAALTPRWQEGEPPEDEWVLLDGHDRPTVFRKFGGCFRYWGGAAWYVWTRKIRWAHIPKPTEG